jgi:hypothetical protein
MGDPSHRCSRSLPCSAPQQVSGLSVSPVVVLSVAGQHSLHNTASGIFPLLDKEMEVVRDQAVGKGRNAVWASASREVPASSGSHTHCVAKQCWSKIAAVIYAPVRA